jgi:hypothetical protein
MFSLKITYPPDILSLPARTSSEMYYIVTWGYFKPLCQIVIFKEISVKELSEFEDYLLSPMM